VKLSAIAKDKSTSGIAESVPVSAGANRALFDREAMRQYQKQWALSRNKQYYHLVDYGY